VVEPQRETFQVYTDRVIIEESWNTGEDADNVLKEMMTYIWKMTIKVFGVIKGNKHKSKDT
jgi:hypothetical protein